MDTHTHPCIFDTPSKSLKLQMARKQEEVDKKDTLSQNVQMQIWGWGAGRGSTPEAEADQSWFMKGKVKIIKYLSLD